MCPRLKEECSVTCKCIATNNQVEVMHLLISKKKSPSKLQSAGIDYIHWIYIISLGSAIAESTEWFHFILGEPLILIASSNLSISIL